jgi:RNA polymerase sigma factor (TIGR02999 family)
MMDDWFSAAYKELRRLAASVKRNDARATISTSTLVHEAWMKLAGSPGLAPESELHFKRTAACAMRQIVMDEARRHSAYKRGGRGVALFVTLDDSLEVPVSCDQDLLRLDAALDALTRVNPRQAELVQLRFFGGHEVAEASALLGIAESTALRDWRVAKAWLAAEVRKGR